ncbi:MAG: hypothetical protein DRJ42_12895 [Deltaproteobacteria bacterium]|nr:MAG: hypothetical protein DRJ42_12895 [Deltaproteobacteria bacterium]
MSNANVDLTDGYLHCNVATVPDLTSYLDADVRHLHLDRKVKKAPGLDAFLDQCTTLRGLTIHQPALLDPAPTKTAIELLDISGTKLRSLDFLAGFPELRRLSLGFRGTEVADFTPVRHVPHLERLRANGHRAGTIKPLRALEHLEEYVAHQTKALASLDGLDGCPKLVHVDANQSRIASLDALSGATMLRALKIRGTKVPSLDAIYGCHALETLFAERTKLKSIDGIAEGLPGLRLLWLHNTAITDLSPLRGLRSLLELDLGGLAVDDFNVLGDLPSLEHLDFHGTKFSDLSVLESLPNLVSARLTSTKVREKDPRVAKLNRKLRAKHGRDGGLSFDARSGMARLGVNRATCTHGDLQHDEENREDS